jgi:glutamate racemase
MVEVIAKAASIDKYTPSAELFQTPQKKKHAVIVGGTHLIALSGLFPSYALEATVLIPSTTVELDREVEFERAVQFEDTYPEICRGIGLVRDLSGLDTESADLLIVCTHYPAIRDEFLSQAWRVLIEFGKLIVFSPTEIPLSYLGRFGMAAPTYYPVEGFYAGTMRKGACLYAHN